MNGGVRHEAAHAVAGWRSSAVEVQSIIMGAEPHVRMRMCKQWEMGSDEAVIAAVGPLSEDPTAFDDYEAVRDGYLMTDERDVLRACALAGQKGSRRGQEWWFRSVRDEALDLLEVHVDDIDRVAAALADRGTLDQDDLTVLLGAQIPVRQPL